MAIERILIICCGTVAMLLQMILRRKNYPTIALWKFPVFSILLTVAGVAGTMLLFYIESGRFGGTSFYGAVLFVPLLILPACLLRIPYGSVLDLSAPAICLMLAIMKVDCLMSGCCIGKYLPSLGFQFPSQIVEMITALIIMFVLLSIEKKGRRKTALYACFMVLYGSTRFVLNWFRYGLTPYVWILPQGNFWSVIAVFLGAIWLWRLKKTVK